MDIQYIDKKLDVVEQALRWHENVPASEQLEYKKKLINIRRSLKRIRYAVSEPCSTAAFGESQMGKSYLVSAMLSTPSHPFSVTDGKKEYNFISEINPSSPNSTIEATGVITRFTTKQDEQIPQGYLKVQLLSVSDIILILCEAFYNQVDYLQESLMSTDEINEYIDNIVPENPQSVVAFLTEDDIQDIREYLSDKSAVLHKKVNHIINQNCNIFNFLISHIKELSESQVSDIIQLLWNRDKFFGQLWTDMLTTYKRLNYSSFVYARFDSVLKRKGTLLDVARLDEMYGQPEDVRSEYTADAEVQLPNDNKPIKVKKSFLSSLIAELSFGLPSELAKTHPFLNYLDILDFPGARRPEQIKQEKLGEGKNLSTVLRRGKVSYLFNKYSSAKRISTLLFCHNNSMSAESSMGSILDKWVLGNIGETSQKREEYVKSSVIPPIFIIGTWFNKDLEYQDEKQGDVDSLNTRWNRRFNVVLEKEVLKSLGDSNHWFNNWTVTQKTFQNIYMLRDFKYSKNIYNGYDALNGKPEEGEAVRPIAYPDFFEDLKKSFVTNEFVTKHFANPYEAWDAAATCAQDGTQRIIKALNLIAPNVTEARNRKFSEDVKKTLTEFSVLLSQYYHPDSSEEQLKLAKRQAGTSCLQIDRMIGKDSYSFGRLMDSLMISESEIYELVHSQLLGEEQPLPMSDEEAQIFMSAGLDSNASRADNIERLCDYLGVDTEDECKAELEGIDLENLLSHNQMVTGRADKLVASVEELWHNNVLMKRCVQTFEDVLPSIYTIMSSLWKLYKQLNVRDTLVKKVDKYLDDIDKETSIGIISDYLSMEFNKFSSTFGYAFLQPNDRDNVISKNKGLRLHIDTELLEDAHQSKEISLLSDMYKQRETLTNRSFGQQDKRFLASFPQYRHVWRWEQQLRMGYIYTSKLPDFDIKANDSLRIIIQDLKK